MTDSDCVQFLQWALPRLRLRWPGFRKVRRQVCKRIARRMAALGLARAKDYRAHLESHEDEWAILDSLCRVTISRFGRDRAVFVALEETVLPALAAEAGVRGESALCCWSAGCASGEEPYSLALAWRYGVKTPPCAIDILATDVDPALLARAERATYPAGALKELPAAWRTRTFTQTPNGLRLAPGIREMVRFHVHDVRSAPPDGPFDLILCRNLVFTYFDEGLQRDTLGRMVGALRPCGGLVVGAHEALPESASDLAPWPGLRGIYRRVGRTAAYRA